MLRGVRAVIVCACAFALASPGDAAAGDPALAFEPHAATGKTFVPGEVIVGFTASSDPAQRIRARRALSAELDRRLLLPRMQLLELEPGDSVREAAEALERQPGVRYAEPNFVVRAAAVPDDPGFAQLWGLHNASQAVLGKSGTTDADIDAPQAWDVEIGEGGASGPVVAVVDSGVTADHEDLAANVVAGYDFVDDDDDPTDLNGHGTHVAGTIGAEGSNQIGVVGVNWAVRLMPLRVLDADGVGEFADVVDAFAYADQNGADVVNASIGGAPGEEMVSSLTDAVNAADETLFVAAAGNSGSNNDIRAEYPCNIDASNLVCVAATDQDDGLADFSNFGPNSVDLAAPGVNILSTYLGQDVYAYASGTSMATPHVAGVAALALSLDPTASVAELRGALLGGVDAKDSLVNRVATCGRLNAATTLAIIAGAQAPAAVGSLCPQSEPQSEPPPPPPPPADTTEPELELRGKRKQPLRKVVVAKVRCDEPCVARANGKLRAAGKKARLKPRPKRLALGANEVGKVKLKLPRKARRAAKRALKRDAKVIVKVKVRATDAAGNSAKAKRKIRLKG